MFNPFKWVCCLRRGEHVFYVSDLAQLMSKRYRFRGVCKHCGVSRTHTAGEWQELKKEAI